MISEPLGTTVYILKRTSSMCCIAVNQWTFGTQLMNISDAAATQQQQHLTIFSASHPLIVYKRLRS